MSKCQEIKTFLIKWPYFHENTTFLPFWHFWHFWLLRVGVLWSLTENSGALGYCQTVVSTGTDKTDILVAKREPLFVILSKTKEFSVLWKYPCFHEISVFTHPLTPVLERVYTPLYRMCQNVWFSVVLRKLSVLHMENVDFWPVLTFLKIRVFIKTACHEKCAIAESDTLRHVSTTVTLLSFIIRFSTKRRPKQWVLSVSLKRENGNLAVLVESLKNSDFRHFSIRSQSSQKCQKCQKLPLFRWILLKIMKFIENQTFWPLFPWFWQRPVVSSQRSVRTPNSRVW